MATQNTFVGIVNDPLQYNAGSPIIQGIAVNVPQAIATTPLSGNTVTLDWTINNHQRFLLDRANTAVVLPAPLGVYSMHLVVVQDGAGGRLMTWPVATKFVAATAPVLSVGSNVPDLLELITDGTTWYVLLLGKAMWDALP
jgi:hypothetical protein